LRMMNTNMIAAKMAISEPPQYHRLSYGSLWFPRILPSLFFPHHASKRDGGYMNILRRFFFFTKKMQTWQVAAIFGAIFALSVVVIFLRTAGHLLTCPVSMVPRDQADHRSDSTAGDDLPVGAVGPLPPLLAIVVDPTPRECVSATDRGAMRRMSRPSMQISTPSVNWGRRHNR